jgi:hypothetical protein
VKFESGKVRTSALSVPTIKRELERAGVEFPEGEPPRLKAGVPMKHAQSSPYPSNSRVKTVN